MWEAYTNITVDYSSRVQPYSNGSMGLSDLRLQDGGFYVVTVTEATGNSKDFGFVLKVNGESGWQVIMETETSHCDIQTGRTGMNYF